MKKHDQQAFDDLNDILKDMNWNMTARTNRAQTRVTVVLEKVSR